MSKRKIDTTAGVVIGLLLVVLAAGTYYSQQRQKTATKLSSAERREIHSTFYPKYAHDRKLQEIDPGQDVDIESSPGMKFEVPGPNYRKNPACTTDAIIVGVVKDQSSYLTQEETFILSDYTISVEKILKDNPAAQMNPGDSIVVNRPGGILVLGGRKAETIDKDYDPLRLAGRYLLYLQFIPETSSYRGLLPDVTLENPDPKALVQTRQDLAGCGPAGGKLKR
jgi:hypothetical protein